MAQVVGSSGKRLSLGERDRRYAALRARLKDRGVDGVVVSGSNLFYLTNGLAGEEHGALATAGGPLTVWLHSRHLADLGPEQLIESQEWVQDVRRASTAETIAVRLRELGIGDGTIGLTGSGAIFGGLSYGMRTGLQAVLPEATIVDVSDIFNDLRTLKSAEEIALIDRANLMFDLAVERMAQVGRPGMTGARVVQEGVRAMWDAGADMDSTIGMCFGPMPKQNPILCALSLERVIEPGDIGTVTAHSEWGGYAGHSDQEIAFGEPRPELRAMFDAVVHVRERVLTQLKPGNRHSDLQRVYEEACKETGFRSSPHSQMHQYGIDVPEFPGPAFAAGPQRDWVITPGMIYSISPTLVAQDGGDTMLGGNSLVVTESGYRELGDRKVEMYRAQS